MEDGISSATGCVNRDRECCVAEIPLMVKNCSQGYVVYLLHPTPDCNMGYCVGEGVRCPQGMDSANGYTPCICKSASVFIMDCYYKIMVRIPILAITARDAACLIPTVATVAIGSLFRTLYGFSLQVLYFCYLGHHFTSNSGIKPVMSHTEGQ